MSTRSLFTIFILLLILFAVPQTSSAQILDEEERGDETIIPDESIEEPVIEIPEEPEEETPTTSELTEETPAEGAFTGTLSDEDPESSAFKEKQLFGEDEAETEGAEEGDTTPGPEAGVPTHVLKFEFDGQVTVTNTLTEVSFLEINYTTKIEKEIEVKNSRYRATTKAEIMTDIVGDLAGNELFTCKLDIQIENADVDIMTKYNLPVENEENITPSQLALQLKFKKEMMLEGWLSNCMAVDGSLFNTIGEKEKYLYQIFEAIEPKLDGMIFDEYVLTESATLDLTSEATVIEDPDSFEEFTLEGTGKVTVEPIEAQ